jgi:hypothetical protein
VIFFIDQGYSGYILFKKNNASSNSFAWTYQISSTDDEGYVKITDIESFSRSNAKPDFNKEKASNATTTGEKSKNPDKTKPKRVVPETEIENGAVIVGKYVGKGFKLMSTKGTELIAPPSNDHESLFLAKIKDGKSFDWLYTAQINPIDNIQEFFDVSPKLILSGPTVIVTGSFRDVINYSKNKTILG